MPVIRLPTTQPTLNLAIEESLLDRIDESGPMLLLWRNDPSVVIGRHQNPWLECDLARMRVDDVPLVRRTSGGGAVYHDAGNTNFSFIAPSTLYDQERHFRVVISALSSLGIDAWKTDRNDLRVGDRKISGNAFRHTKGHSLHHGTLLVDADLDRLTAYLAPASSLIETKATASVRSVVMNLREVKPGLTHANLWDALEAAFVVEYEPDPDEAGGRAGRPTGTPLNVASLTDSPAIRARAAELASWEWAYGHAPAFVRTVEAADGRRVAVHVRHGRIESVEGARDSLAEALRGVRYEPAALGSAEVTDSDRPIVGAIAAGI